MKQVDFFIDGVHFDNERHAPYSCALASDNLSPGAHTLTARAVDGSGNEASKAIEIVVDDTPSDENDVRSDDSIPPSITWIRPGDGETISYLMDETCEVAVTDNERVERVDFFVDGEFFDDEHYAPYDCQMDSGHLGPGTHTVTARAIDASGNEAARSIQVNVENESPLWHGDFETGDLSQWDMIQRVADDRITVVQDPVRQGHYAARFEVTPEDRIGDTSPRAEVAEFLNEQEGDERYYKWSTFWTPDFPTDYPNDFITFTQWRAEDESGAYTSFMVWGNRIELWQNGIHWSAPLVKGVWHEFIYHVKWSPDPDVGFIELWFDGELVVPKRHIRTMAGSPGNAVSNYVKQGLYKEDVIPTGVLYHDGFTAGTSLEALTDE